MRMRMRLSFRDWSRAVDKPDGLAKARAWIALAERMVNGKPIALPTNDDLVRDLLLFGRSAAHVSPDGVVSRVTVDSGAAAKAESLEPLAPRG